MSLSVPPIELKGLIKIVYSCVFGAVSEDVTAGLADNDAATTGSASTFAVSSSR